MARLDQLPAAKQVAQIGAVLGREFLHTLLVAAAGLPEEQVTKGLDQLVASGLVFRRGLPPEAAYTFKHALVQDIAYESLLKTQRQQAHQQIAETMRDQLPDAGEVEPAVVAYHFTRAGKIAPAVEWWGKAGELALQRSAYTEAIAHLEKALGLYKELLDGPEERRSRLRLLIAYGNALRVVRGFGAPETRAAFASARELAAATDQIPERLPAYYGLWSGSFLRGELMLMQEMADAFLRDAERQPESPEAAIAHRLCGMTRWFEGDFVGARTHLERTLALYDNARDRELAFRFGQDVASSAMAYLALVLWPLGILGKARQVAEETIIHALRTKHVPTIAYAYAHSATFEMMRGDRLLAAPKLEGFLGLAREHGMPLWIAYGTFFEGWLRLDGDDRERGIAEMQDGMALLFAQYVKIFVPLFATRLANPAAQRQGLRLSMLNS